MRIHLVIFFFWIIFPVSIGFGQKFQYVTYMDEDLPFREVNQVIQDEKSYMWLATDQGLYRFDGSVFEDYNTNLESRYIKALIHLDEKSILFSNDTGVYRIYYNGDNVRIEPFIEVDESLYDLEYPRDLHLDSNGLLWIGQLNGTVFIFDHANGVTNRLRVVEQVRIESMLFGEDSFNTVWAFVPGEGLYAYDPERIRFEEVGKYGAFKHFKVIDDRILLVGDQVLQLQIDGNRKIRKTENLIQNTADFSYVTVDKTGMIFLASEDRLYTVNTALPNTLRPVFGSNDPHRVEPLPFTEVNQIYFSSDQVRIGGKIWVSTNEGLGLLYSGFFKSVSGMPMGNTFSIGMNFRNEILVSQGNILRVRNVNGEDSFDEFKTDGIRVTSITKSNGQDVWFGTSEGKIIRARNQILGEFDLSDRGGGIFYMYEDSADNIWFCQAPTDKPIIGVGKINSVGQFEEYSTDKGLKSRVLVLDEGGKSELYAAGIGIESYLYKFDSHSNRFENKSLPFPFKVSKTFEVHDITVDSRGIVWMGTTDGLLKYDTERIQRIDLGEYTEIEIRSLQSMPDGSIWMATDTSGMIHLDADGHFVCFDEKSGTPSKIASYRAMLLDNANRLWVGTAEGVVYSVLPFPSPLSTKKPLLNGIMVNARNEDLESSLEFSREDIVDFNFTSISYPGDENIIQYKYYAAGLPKDEIEDVPWVSGESDSRVRIRTSTAGSYILEARAQQPGGYNWSLPMTIPFQVGRSWYATWWGIIFLVMVGAVAFSYGIRFFSRKQTAQLLSLLNTKERELSAKEELLLTQEDTMKHQKEALKSAGVNTYLLYRMMRQIPRRAPWSRVIPVLSKMVELPTEFDALELAFQKGSTIQHLGYIRGKKDVIQREEEFNEKENLTSYVMVHRKPLIIKDYEVECGQYISIKDSRGYSSRMYIPFKQSKGADAIFCCYSKNKDQFSNQDLVILQILTTFLSADVTNELK